MNAEQWIKLLPLQTLLSLGSSSSSMFSLLGPIVSTFLLCFYLLLFFFPLYYLKQIRYQPILHSDSHLLSSCTIPLRDFGMSTSLRIYLGKFKLSTLISVSRLYCVTYYILQILYFFIYYILYIIYYIFFISLSSFLFFIFFFRFLIWYIRFQFTFAPPACLCHRAILSPVLP